MDGALRDEAEAGGEGGVVVAGAEGAADGGEEVAAFDRLFQDGRGVGGFGFADQVGRIAGRDEDTGNDGDLGREFRFNMSDHVQTGHDAHLHIEQREIDGMLVNDFEGGFAAIGLDDLEEGLEQVAEHFTKRRIVIHEQQLVDGFFGSRRSRILGNVW